MRMNEKRESAQIIEFPMNRRFEARRADMAQTIDPRVVAALDPAWYHMEAVEAPTPAIPPRH